MKKIFFLLIFFLFQYQNVEKSYVISDSDLTFDEAIQGTTAPKEIIDSLVLIDVIYLSFDSQLHKGQLVVHKELANEIIEIFDFMRNIRYPIEKVVPIVKYNWSDIESMKDNNTSSFNYRTIAGTNRLSLHSFGRAIDINPLDNPVVYPDGSVVPEGGRYNKKYFVSFHSHHPVVRKFKQLGWRWGGEFSSYKDYHHFDKVK